MRALSLRLKSSAALGASQDGGDQNLQQSLRSLSVYCAGSKVLGRLRERGQALLDAHVSERPTRLLAASALCRAVRGAQLPTAATAPLRPLSNPAPGAVSRCRSSQGLSRLRSAVYKKGSGRLAVLRTEVLEVDDIRLGAPLNAALSGPLAELAEELLARAIPSQAWLLDLVEAELLSGRHSPITADLRRLRLVRAASAPRTWALGRRLLEGQPKAALRCEIYRSMGSDPGALSTLLAAARRGPKPCRRAAMLALLERPEPESLAPLFEELARPGTDLELFDWELWRAAGRRRAFVEALRAREAALEAEGDEDAASVYSRALGRCSIAFLGILGRAGLAAAASSRARPEACQSIRPAVAPRAGAGP